MDDSVLGCWEANSPSAFYMILAVVNILTSCCISGRRQRPPLAYSRRSLMGPLNFGGWMFAHIPPCFFAWTYTWKRLSSLRDQYELQPLVTTGPRNLSTGLRKFSARLHKPMPETRSLITGEPSQTPLLLQALWRYEVLTSIASHLHYVDIINLGRTSRDIRSVIFSDGRRPSDSLVLLTCRGSREQECWFCGRKVCLVRISYPHYYPCIADSEPGLQRNTGMWGFFLNSPPSTLQSTLLEMLLQPNLSFRTLHKTV